MSFCPFYSLKLFWAFCFISGEEGYAPKQAGWRTNLSQITRGTQITPCWPLAFSQFFSLMCMPMCEIKAGTKISRWRCCFLWHLCDPHSQWTSAQQLQKRHLRKEQGYRCYCNTVPRLLCQEESQKRTGLPVLLQWPMLSLGCCARTKKQVPVQVPERRSPSPQKNNNNISFDAIPLSGYGTTTSTDERVGWAVVLPYLLRRWLLLWHVWHEQQGVVDTRHAAALHTSPLPSAPPPSLLRWTLLSRCGAVVATTAGWWGGDHRFTSSEDRQSSFNLNLVAAIVTEITLATGNAVLPKVKHATACVARGLGTCGWCTHEQGNSTHKILASAGREHLRNSLLQSNETDNTVWGLCPMITIRQAVHS